MTAQTVRLKTPKACGSNDLAYGAAQAYTPVSLARLEPKKKFYLIQRVVVGWEKNIFVKLLSSNFNQVGRCHSP